MLFNLKLVLAAQQTLNVSFYSIVLFTSYLSYIIFNNHTTQTRLQQYKKYTRNNTAFIHSNSLIRLIIVSPYYLYTLSRFSQLVTTINLIRTDPTKSKSKKKKNKKNPNWIKKNEIETKSKKNTKKSNKLRSNQAVFMVGVSRYLIAVDSWLRSRHHHRYLCRRPLNSAAHHCHHHCTYLHKHLYNASALALLSLSRSLSL